MSNVSLPKVSKSCDGWETIEGESQEFDAPANMQQQQKESSDWSHDEKQAQTEPTSETRLKKILVNEHQHYDIVIESPGMKAPAQRKIFDIPDNDDEDEIIDIKNKETEEEFIRLARKNFEERNLATASSDD